MITITAPEGIGEVTPDTDLAAMIIDACARDTEMGGLAEGDIVVVTSKIISKAEGRYFPAEEKISLRQAESTRTVARKFGTRIVATHHGLVQAGAGIDASNVDQGTILALPLDSDRSATELASQLLARTGLRVGVIISDTAGRAWRLGQTDHAIGSSGVRALRSYAGEVDSYGHELRVTLTALADEMAAAADLAKGKLGGRPIAVLRGLGDYVVADGEPARALTRPVDQDLFSHGSREAVLAAVLATVGQSSRYEEIVDLDDPDEIVATLGLTEAEAGWVHRLVATATALFA